MLEGIFHDGLQNKRRHHRLRQVDGIRDAPPHLHTVPKADVIDGVVFIHDPHLAGQRHPLIIAHQAVPQQVAQRCDQRLGAVGFLLPCRLQYDIQGVEQEMRIDLTAQLLHPAALHPVLQLQCGGLLLVELPLHLILFPQGVHLLGHRMFHPVEGIGQLADLIVLLGHRHIGGIVPARNDLLRRTDHLLHRPQQPQHRPHHHAAQHQADHRHDRLGPLDPAAQGRDLGVGALRIRDRRVEQLLGVLTQIAAAGRHLVVVELRRPGIVPCPDGFFQLLYQRRVALIGGADGVV
uniref:Uncharacterized protein n=1 Tax=uncultured organism TaxID=155900 RepID=A0A447I4X7_9ZZZZ|nr:hypothetical protein [uncultured organism]